MIYITLVLALGVIGLTVWGAVCDFRGLKIPNIISVCIIGAFVISFYATPEFFFSWWLHLLSMLTMFLLTFIMFTFGVIGGGDSKMASAVSLWLGFKGVAAFVFSMALAGGILGVVGLWIIKKKPFASPRIGGWVDQLQNGRNAVPYGIAICIGTIVGFLKIDLFFNYL